MHGFAFEMPTWDTLIISYHAVFEVKQYIKLELGKEKVKKK
jgi:hypothetical protein